VSRGLNGYHHGMHNMENGNPRRKPILPGIAIVPNSRRNTLTPHGTHREFLRIAAAMPAAPYVITTAALGAEGKPAASERITIGLIGCGPQGKGVTKVLAPNDFCGVSSQE